MSNGYAYKNRKSAKVVCRSLALSVLSLRSPVKENLLCVIGSVDADKPMLTVMLSDDMVKDHQLNAGQMVREAAKLIKNDVFL